MNNRLSHSALNKYSQCPKEYELHYRRNLRPKTTTAALLFGSAIDAAFTTMLKGGDKKPEEVFAYYWRFQDINGEKTYIPKALNVVYSNNDFDVELLVDDDYTKIQEELKLESKAAVLAEIDKVYSEKDTVGFDCLPGTRKYVLNFINWFSMYRKGLLMITTLREKVLPNIEKVYSAQSKIELANQDGDSVIGYIDLVVKWKGIDKPVVMDLKTSARPYDDDAVKTSQQLALYVHSIRDQYEHTDKAGFIVLSKNIRKNKTKKCSVCTKDGTGQRHKTCDAEIEGKRCGGNWIETINPEADVQILINDIPEQFENIVLENFDEVNKAIKAEVFPRNLSNCVRPWGKCSFFSLCHSNKKDDLVTIEPKERE